MDDLTPCDSPGSSASSAQCYMPQATCCSWRRRLRAPAQTAVAGRCEPGSCPSSPSHTTGEFRLPSALAAPWGALLGVMGAPLTVAGLWLFYRGVLPAGPWTAVPPTILFLGVAVVGPFVHGSFAFVRDTVQLLYEVEEVHRVSLSPDYAARSDGYAGLCAAAARRDHCVGARAAATVSGVEDSLDWRGQHREMRWTWLLVKRGLPTPAGEFLQGAGFNIAYGAWFAAMTMTVR